MFTTRTTEAGVQQAALESLYLRRIRKINAKLRRFNATYNDWADADERLRSHYTREEFRELFIERWSNERHAYVLKLRDVRRGIIHT